MSAVLVISVAFAQSIVSIRFIDQETGLPVKGAIIQKKNGSSDSDGYLQVTCGPGDTLTILAPGYPDKKVIVGSESELTVTLSKVADETSIFTVVDETAEFPGGMTAYYQYVAGHLVYPVDAARAGVQGKVFVEFVINADGTIAKESVRVLAGPDPLLNAEAIRVARESPAWKPGKKNGQPVRQRMVLPYAFRLEDKRKKR